MVYGHICQWTGHTDGPINNKVGANGGAASAA